MKKILLVLMILVLMTTGCTKNEPEVKEDVITSHSWFASDNSYLVFEGEEFRWYQTKEIQDDNYYEGSYIIYYNQEAMDYYIEFMDSYGIDGKESLESSLAGAKQNGLSEANFTILILENKSALIGGIEQDFEPYSSVYVGYYAEKEGSITLDFANLSTGNRAYFESE